MKSIREIVNERNEMMRNVLLKECDIAKATLITDGYLVYAYGEHILGDVEKYLNQDNVAVDVVDVSDELYEHIRNAEACVDEALNDDGRLREKDKNDRYSQALWDLQEAMKMIRETES